MATTARTEINSNAFDLTDEDLITPTDMVVTLSYTGYAKAQPVADYQAQRRGGKGRIATRNKDEDFVRTMFVANSHDTILCFSSAGKVYWLKVYQLPQAGRSRSRPSSRQPAAIGARGADHCVSATWRIPGWAFHFHGNPKWYGEKMRHLQFL